MMRSLTSGYQLALLFAFCLAMFTAGCGEEVTDAGPRSQGELREYHIMCDLVAFDSIMSNHAHNIYIPIRIGFRGDTTTARMRVRGDTSREDPKKSLKIKFDSTALASVPKVLNLNAEYADKTYVRQLISSLLMKGAGQLCFNAGHAKVFLNGSFLGLYLQVENMDKHFLARNGLPVDGNLYKATRDGACLSVFDDIDAKWEKKTNTRSDRNDLSDLIVDLDQVHDTSFHEFLRRTFHYDELVNTLALNMMLSNASTYYHNYYMFHDLYGTGKWRILPWDMDKTLSYYNWMPYTYHRTSSEWESDNPLVERAILCPPVMKDISGRINELYATELNDAAIGPIIDSLTNLLADAIPLDTMDQLSSVDEWKGHLDRERTYFSKHHARLQQQFDEHPSSFHVQRIDQLVTDTLVLHWHPATHPQGRSITYTVTCGPDHLLLDSLTTQVTHGITDTTWYKVGLPEDIYYYKVTATDGEHQVDGFNTKNKVQVKYGTSLPARITRDHTLTAARSPYVATPYTYIEAGATVRLEAGVEVQLPANGRIECHGNFIAEGTSIAPITFHPKHSVTSWDHIYFLQGCELASLKHVNIWEGVLNSKAKEFRLDHCTMKVKAKDMGRPGGKRIDLIYADHGLLHITNSHFTSNGGGEGMVLFHSEVYTENCIFENVPDAIEYISCDKGSILGNYVTGSPDDAIDLNDCNNIVIEGNFLLDNKDKAISIGTEQYGPSKHGIHIDRNLIVGNRTGVAVKDSSFARISNCTFVDNRYAIHAYKKREDYVLGGSGVVTNCLLQGNTEANAYANDHAELKVSHTMVKEKTLAGDNNLKADPDFLDPGYRVFHLSGNSAAIGKADDGNDLGMFLSNEKPIRMTMIHVRSAEDRETGDYITLTNPYNMPVSLDRFKLLIEHEGDKKEYRFPVGTTIHHSGELTLCSDHAKFRRFHAERSSIGGLPKLKSGRTTIKLMHRSGEVIDSFTYEVTDSSKTDVTYYRVEGAGADAWETKVAP